MKNNYFVLLLAFSPCLSPLNAHTYLFIPMYALGLTFQHNLYSCLCDLESFARGRFTPLALAWYFISPGDDGRIHVYLLNRCDT